MTIIHQHLLKSMIDDFEKTYEVFLKSEKLEDTPLTKAGFYGGIMSIVAGNPIPYPELQGQIEDHICDVWAKSLDGYLDKIEMMIQEVGRIRELS